MADVAAHLVDRVLPAAPCRQGTLSVPRRLAPRDRRFADPGDVVWLYELEVFASIGRAAAWRRHLFD